MMNQVEFDKVVELRCAEREAKIVRHALLEAARQIEAEQEAAAPARPAPRWRLGRMGAAFHLR